MSNGKRTNPFKGLKPYEESDKEDFRGREKETEELFLAVKTNFFTIVFGKSGIGKTSLLNAGLFPKLRDEDYLPIPVRVDYAKEAAPLLEQINQFIRKEIKNHQINLQEKNENEPAEPIAHGEPLLKYISRVRHFDDTYIRQLTPVLVFDQFEELFTLGKNHRDADDLIDQLSKMIEHQSSVSNNDKVVRIVISLREDFLGDFSDLKKKIDLKDPEEFRVIRLNGKQAREIITRGGAVKDEKFINDILHRFYPEDADFDKIISDEKLEIESIFLSLLCYQLYEKQAQDLTTLPGKDADKILEEFYDGVINKFPPKVEKFIENNLLSKGGFRTLYPLSKNYRLTEYISQLIEEKVLRKEHREGREYIEIIHDVLAPIIKEKRSRRTKKVTNWIISGFSFFLLGLIALTLFAFYQKNRADEQSKIAIEQYRNAHAYRLTYDALTEFPNENTRAIRIAEAAYEMGLPNPPLRTIQVLSKIGYSSLERPFYNTIFKHEGSIHTACFSPDGPKILTGAEDGTVTVWDREGKLLKKFNNHIERIMSAVFSPDGSRILTAYWDSNVKLWDLDGNCLANLNNHKRVVGSAVFSADGRLILTASWDGTAILWNRQGKPMLKLEHKAAVSSAVFSPDGSRVLTASWDKSAKLWDLEGNLLINLPHNKAVLSAVFSPDGQRILTVCQKDIAKIWDIKGNLLYDLKHVGEMNPAVFSLDGQQILTTSKNGTLRTWDKEGKLLLDLKLTELITSALFSPNGQQVLTVSKNGIARIWELANHILADLNKHKEVVESAVFSPDGKRILTASWDHTAKLWDLEKFQLSYLAEFKHSNSLSGAVFSPDGLRVLTASRDTTAKLWDLDGNPKKEFKHDGAVFSAVFSPEGQRILTACEDGTAKVWNLEGNVIIDLPKHAKGVSNAVFSPNGQQILTASEDGTAKLWDLEKGLLANLKHKKWVKSAVFSPDGNRILTASFDGTAKIWSLGGELIQNLENNSELNSALFSPDGHLIITASRDGTAKLWDLEGQLLADLNKHKEPVLSAVFSPNGHWILTTSSDCTVKLWLTPGAIYEWLKTAKIAQLSTGDREKLKIR